jgi:hypothetical protein
VSVRHFLSSCGSVPSKLHIPRLVLLLLLLLLLMPNIQAFGQHLVSKYPTVAF